MKLETVLLASLLFTTVSLGQQSPDLQTALVAKANDLYTAHQHTDENLFLKTISPDLLFLGHTGRFTVEQMFSDLAGAPGPCSLGSFKITQPLLRNLGPDAAVLTYHLHQQAACNDVPEPSELTASDTFTKVAGEWRIVVHTETPLK